MSNSGDYEILYCECRAGGWGGGGARSIYAGGGGVFTACPPPPISNPGDVAGGCKLLRNRFESRDREWASYTCVLGFHVFGAPCRGGDLGVRGGGGGGKATLTPPPPPGVWPDGSDGTDINSLCRSHHERLVAVADDFCKVHLFQYPCARPKVCKGPGGAGGRGEGV